MSSVQFTHTAQSAQTSTQAIQSSRFCSACQLGIHCGQCTCCSGHHLSNTFIRLSDDSIIRVPDGADPDAYRRFCESKIKLAANPKKAKKSTYRPRQSKRNRRTSLSLPFDAGMQATARRMAELASEAAKEPDDDPIFVNGLLWEIPFMGEPVVYEDERDSRFECAI